MIMIMDDRDCFEELMSRSADYFQELARRVAAEGVDFVFAADDFAFKSGLFVNPKLFEEIWRPHFDRILDPFRDANIPIMFHSDGKIDEAMDMLIDMGVDCVTPMDPSGIDYREYKKRYGDKVSLMGNIDLTWPLIEGTPSDVEKDVREHAETLKAGGRWVAASSHSIVNYIPHENFIAMINAFHKYGAF
jgi:uroporphyrinogen decarboxylase